MFTTSISAVRANPINKASAFLSEIESPYARKLWSSLKEVCDLLGIAGGPSVENEKQLFQHLPFQAGQRIYTMGAQFDMLYVVRSGFVKTVMIDETGQEQILGFPMRGNLIGVDGIDAKRYQSEAVALSTCDIIAIPFKQLAALGRAHPGLDVAIYSLISRDILTEQSLVGMLGSLSAEARVARFLVWMSNRFSEMGYSGKQFNLRMTRQEIGRYLGLTLETVSRAFSGFKEMDLIAVNQRAVEIKDMQALKTLRRLPPSCNRAKARAAAAAQRAAASEVEAEVEAAAA